MKKGDVGTVRISNQYRDRDRSKGMVYELRSGDAKLVLRSLEAADASGQWRFSAHPMQSPQLVIIGEWGATRIDAFRAVRELWIARGPSLGLTSFDWDEIAAALTQVRALG